MRQRQFFAAFVLACAFALSTNAGDISCGVAATPTPTPQSTSVIETEGADGLTETFLEVIGSVLALL